MTHQSPENSRPLGTPWPGSLQSHVDRRKRHSVREFHAVEMALRLSRFRVAANRTLLGRVSRARWKDVVSFGQKAVSSLLPRFVTRPQNKHARTSAWQRIRRGEIGLSCPW